MKIEIKYTKWILLFFAALCMGNMIMNSEIDMFNIIGSVLFTINFIFNINQDKPITLFSFEVKKIKDDSFLPAPLDSTENQSNSKL